MRDVVEPADKAGGAGLRGFNPVVLIKLHLLQRLYGLSNPGSVEEVADQLGLREFLGLRGSLMSFAAAGQPLAISPKRLAAIASFL